MGWWGAFVRPVVYEITSRYIPGPYDQVMRSYPKSLKAATDYSKNDYKKKLAYNNDNPFLITLPQSLTWPTSDMYFYQLPTYLL